MNRCVEQMHRYVEISPHYHLLVYYLQLNSVFLTNPHLITCILRYLCNSRFQFDLITCLTDFQTFAPLKLLQFFFLKSQVPISLIILSFQGLLFCPFHQRALYIPFLFLKNVVLQQRFCVFIRQSGCIFSAISVTFAVFHSGSWGLHPIKYTPSSFCCICYSSCR